MKTAKNIKKIVLTGGPCAGKSTAVDIIIQELENKGWKVFTCPERATYLFGMGIEISDQGLSLNTFQEHLLLRQISEEDFLYTVAEQHKHEKIVLLLDRGTMDGMAYMPQDEFLSILKKHNLDITTLRDQRYDAIFHLVTAAKGAEPFYTVKNNVTRKEGIEEAQLLDDKTVSVWIGHHNTHIIDNSTPFKEKMERLMEKILNYLEAPTM